MRLFRATVALCALLPLTACAIVVPPLHSPTPTPLPDPVTTSKSAVPQEVAEEQHPQKDVTVGEFLNAGLYRPESNAFGTFRPCAEISAEQWQELGWNVEDREKVSREDKPSRYGSLCNIKAIPGKNLGWASFSVNFEGYDKETGTDNARGDREDLNTLEVKKPKGFYVYAAENSALPGTCMAGVLTKRGRIRLSTRAARGRQRCARPRWIRCSESWTHQCLPPHRHQVRKLQHQLPLPHRNRVPPQPLHQHRHRHHHRQHSHRCLVSVTIGRRIRFPRSLTHARRFLPNSGGV